MKIGDIKNIKVAAKYASALLQTALESKNEEEIYNDLLFISETLCTNPNLSNALLNPVVSQNDKKDILTKIFSVHINKVTLDFVLLIIDNNRLNILDEIIEQYSKMYNKINNIVKPIVISAIELEENQKNKIIQKLEYKLSKKIIPEFRVDSEIIGGLIFEIEDKKLDCSLKTKFDNMKQQLTKGNSYGND